MVRPRQPHPKWMEPPKDAAASTLRRPIARVTLVPARIGARPRCPERMGRTRSDWPKFDSGATPLQPRLGDSRRESIGPGDFWRRRLALPSRRTKRASGLSETLVFASGGGLDSANSVFHLHFLVWISRDHRIGFFSSPSRRNFFFLFRCRQ